MKKILFTMLLVIVGYTTAFAGDKCELTKGSLSTLKNGGIATVAINMSETMFDNKMPLREDKRFTDVDKNIPEYEKEFVREFNEHAKKFQLTQSTSDADYKIAINVKNLDVFVTVMSFKGGVATKIWGTLTISKGNEIIAEFTLDAWESSGMTYSVSLEETYETLAKYLAKRINKGK